MFIQICLLFSIFLMILYRENVYIVYNKAIVYNEFRKKHNISLMYCIKSFFYVVNLFVKMTFIMYLQKKINGWCINELEHNLFEVKLYLKNKPVKVLLKVRRGPNSIMGIKDDNNEDITEKIIPYYNGKCVGCTPDVYKYERIIVNDLDTGAIIINRDDEIN